MDTRLKSNAIIENMKLSMYTDAGKERAKKLRRVYQFKIAPEKIGCSERSFVLDFKRGEFKIGGYGDGKPDATFSITDDDFLKLYNGRLNPTIAFMSGALVIRGSLSAAQKYYRKFDKKKYVNLKYRDDVMKMRANMFAAMALGKFRNKQEVRKRPISSVCSLTSCFGKHTIK